MRKLSKQSPLFDITIRINEIIDELNSNKEVYQNFKPNIGKSLTKTYTNSDLPAIYDVEVMGAYKIELKTEKSKLAYELFIDNESKKGVLDKDNNAIKNIFMSNGDKIIFSDKTLGVDDFVTVSLEMNILDAFIKEYESVQNNIGIVSEISEENKRQMEAIKDTIQNFYGTIEIEPVSNEELQSYLESLEA